MMDEMMMDEEMPMEGMGEEEMAPSMPPMGAFGALKQRVGIDNPHMNHEPWFSEDGGSEPSDGSSITGSPSMGPSMGMSMGEAEPSTADINAPFQARQQNKDTAIQFLREKAKAREAAANKFQKYVGKMASQKLY